jgi:TetR/AcrR family transcriptional regulator, transcriptional repressor for nem operon
MTPARRKLLDAAITLIRQKGYAATSVDDLCAAARVAKGSFFHHFENKEALAVAAAEDWSLKAAALFAAAPYHRLEDPLQRVLGYIELRKSLLQGEIADFTCLVGTMLQEVYASHPAIRDACQASIHNHAEMLEVDIAAAMRRHGVRGRWTAADLALHTQAALQGAYILAKAGGGAAVAAASIDHLHRHVELLFKRAGGTGRRAA